MSLRTSVLIRTRCRGPRRFGNGGYTAGSLATALSPGVPDPTAVQVTLLRPAPLDELLDVVVAQARPAAHLLHRDGPIADAVTAELGDGDGDGAVEPVSYDRALEAEAAYGGLARHPFPGCFGCGTERIPGDALCLRPGPLGDGRTACTWTPHPALGGGRPSVPVVWAALDCPSGWSTDVAGRPMVLGRMTARLDALPAYGERCVVMGELLGEDGRKAFTASTLYGPDGRMLARARHTWIAVDPSHFE